MRTLVILLSSLVLAVPAMDAAADDRTVTVDGHAELRTEPDRATLRLGVESRADDVETARKSVSGIVDRFLQMTRDMSIPDQRVSTASAIVRPDYDWNPQTRERRLLGYVVSRQLEVEIHDLEKLGRLTESALKLGVNQVNPPTLDTSRRAALERQALAEAARDAKSRAVALAEALGAGLGDVRTLQASSAFRPPVPLARGMLAAEADAGGETYQPGEITISGSVSATFDLVLP
jgi:uncharacterized protein YggE